MIRGVNVKELLDKHEAFKAKGLQLSNDDLFSWLLLQDQIIATASDMKAEHLEKKLEIEKDKACRIIELKAEKDENWKTANTDKVIDAIIKREFYDIDLSQIILKNTYELLLQRAWVITELINIVKLNKKTDFTI